MNHEHAPRPGCGVPVGVYLDLGLIRQGDDRPARRALPVSWDPAAELDAALAAVNRRLANPATPWTVLLADAVALFAFAVTLRAEHEQDPRTGVCRVCGPNLTGVYAGGPYPCQTLLILCGALAARREEICGTPDEP